MTSAVPDSRFEAHLAEMMRRADRALEAGRCEALAVAAGFPPLQYRDDQHYPHKAAAHFLSFVPLTDAPGSLVLHRPGRRPQLLFYAPADYWHATPSLPDAPWVAAFDVTLLQRPAEAAALLPAHTAFVGPCPDWLAGVDTARANPEPVLASLDFARANKTPYEIDCLARASALAVAGHAAARAAWLAGHSEYAIHLAYVAATGHEDAELPYHNIIALNEAASVLHYTVRRRAAPRERLSFLIDAGAQYRGYAADVTRTYAAAPGPFADLVAALSALEQDLCSLVTPGRPYPAIHAAAHDGIARILVGAGLVRCSAESAVEGGLTQVFFPHGIGHLLGLQVHDVGGWMADASGRLCPRPQAHPYLRLGRTLEEGTVVTIEPGLYFIPLLLDAARSSPLGRDVVWERVDDLVRYGGIRIEDNVVARASGPQNLTRAAESAVHH